MAVFLSLYTFNTILLHSHSSLRTVCGSHLSVQSLSNFIGGGIVKRSSRRRRRNGTCRFVVLSTHSNPRVLKSNRRSRFGSVLSPFDSDEEEEDVEDEDDEDDDDVAGDDWLSNVSFSYSLFYLSSQICVRVRVKF
jgi:hypothetical protein